MSTICKVKLSVVYHHPQIQDFALCNYFNLSSHLTWLTKVSHLEVCFRYSGRLRNKILKKGLEAERDAVCYF